MSRHRRVVSDRIPVCVSRKTGNCLEDVVALYQASNEMNKMKRLLFSLPLSLPRRTNSQYSVGDQPALNVLLQLVTPAAKGRSKLAFSP
jgi:hypothetical protein